MKLWSRLRNTIKVTATLIVCLAVNACDSGSDSASPTASLIITNGTLYTANAKQEFAEAIAIAGDEIIYVGTDAGAKKFVGDNTQVVDAKGKMVLPGLHDAHIHPLGLVSSSNCDLESSPLTLTELATVITDCLNQAKLEPNQWLTVEQWNFTKGNQPDDELLNIRMALDKASLTTPIFLRGNDGHHGAANSAALLTAKNIHGDIIGLSGKTIATDFQEYAQYIGVDKQGEPDGQLSEAARYILALPSSALTGDGTPEQLSAKLPAIAAILAKSGITSIQDAAADIETLPILEQYALSGQQTYRYTGALIADFANFSRPIRDNSDWTKQNSISEVNINSIIDEFSAIKNRQKNPQIFKTDAAKIFVDGVIEGNPFATPPSLPNAAVKKPYLQPIFQVQDDTLRLQGYVDLDSPACQKFRANPPLGNAEKTTFFEQHQFQPEQCIISNGRLEHDENFIHNYIAQLEAAGFSIHAHAIGDRAVATALDAFEASKAKNKHQRPQTISHAQQISDSDLARFSKNAVYLAFTFAWAIPDYGYDLTVTPYIDKLSSLEDLYNPSNYTITNHYPANSARRNGAVIIAGSDAPVDTRDPRPFINLASAVTRYAEGKTYNESERLSLTDALDAFTINSARAMQQAEITGSLEVGKKADLVLLDRNLVPSAAAFDGDVIAETQVELTVFNGKVIYQKQ
ncbi:amidohydrolase family protein [Simiduia curdlanivorans]|uniref:Amidohydrolase n=1 Tax=Simiduia curdlanivorans TaxID=1492769 RepID=A0ABV8V7H7_9GAMM|nr:amidohydrolase family protein [Simiduia curdlanivorans]MDN3639812.1 amidohydrolase family protein [Simiduia curdlanivorans]